MTYRLICDGDPVRLGIANANGEWNMTAFNQHVDHCAKCRAAVRYLMDAMPRLDLPSCRHEWHRLGMEYRPATTYEYWECRTCHTRELRQTTQEG